jgi:cytochrome bd-type quinol oxidase subunit 2
VREEEASLMVWSLAVEEKQFHNLRETPGMASVFCMAACGTAWAACYAAAGLVAGTITAGVGAPAAALACNAAESACMISCAGTAVGEVTTTPWGWLVAPAIVVGGICKFVTMKRRHGD